MPIYEFLCPNNHITEKLYIRLPKVDIKYIKCTKCREIGIDSVADKMVSRVSPPYSGEPTRIAVNKQGHVQLLSDKYDEPSKEFEVKELKGVRERDKFENEQNQRSEVMARQEGYRREVLTNEITKDRHDDIKSKLNSYDSTTQTLMKEAMNRTLEKNKKSKVIKKPTIHIHANHNHVK